MIPADVLRQVRRLRLRARRAVRAGAGGAYKSAFHGAGLTFEEVRAYLAGDDVRAIDWNVTARAGSPFVKRYAEERELTLLLVVDRAASLRFGTGRRTKRAVAAELGAVLALTAAAHHDRVALVTPGGRVPLPGKGTRHAVRVVRDLLTGDPAPSTLGGSRRGVRDQTELSAALAGVGTRRARRAVVFVLSDFLAWESDARFAAAFRRAARQHDLIAVRVADPRELALPDAGLVALSDAATGEQALVDTGSPAVRAAFARRSAAARDRFARFARGARADLVDVLTTGDHFDALAAFFARRARQRNRA